MLVKTSGGLEINVNEDAFDDMEVLDALTDMVDDDPLAVSRLCKLIMNKSEKKKLYDFCRSEDGKAHMKKTVEVLTEIMIALGDKEKN